jgi:hypothetical protein
VRCAGTAKPESKAYSSAVANPATAAALTAASFANIAGIRRHPHSTSAKITPDTIVI